MIEPLFYSNYKERFLTVQWETFQLQPYIPQRRKLCVHFLFHECASCRRLVRVSVCARVWECACACKGVSGCTHSPHTHPLTLARTHARTQKLQHQQFHMFWNTAWNIQKYPQFWNASLSSSGFQTKTFICAKNDRATFRSKQVRPFPGLMRPSNLFRLLSTIQNKTSQFTAHI